MKRTLQLFVLFAAWNIAGLPLLPAGEPEDFFPLKEGIRWTYEARHSSYDEVGSITVINFAKGDLSGIPVTTQKITIENADSFRYIGDGPEGIFSVAFKLPGALEPTMEEDPRYLIRHPVMEGTTWKHPRGKAHSVSRILGLRATVNVPAGIFTECLIVKEVEVPTQEGAKYPKRVTSYYYAPNVGLVKKQTRLEVLREVPDGVRLVTMVGEKNLTSFSK